MINMMTEKEKLINLLEEHIEVVVDITGEPTIEVNYGECAAELIANGVTVQRWIPVTERLPEPEKEVLVLTVRRYMLYGEMVEVKTVVTGMYEDGRKPVDESEWYWHYTDGFPYDDELGLFIIPESWWEYKHYNGDDEYNHLIDDVVTHWMSLPELPKDGDT